MLDTLVHIAGYAALAVLAFLMMANVVITSARLVHHRPFAARIVAYLSPFALLFRLGNPHIDGASRRNA